MDLEKNCPRNVRRSIYERNAPETANWWYKVFKTLESEAAIPPDVHLEVVEDILPKQLLNRVLSILSFIRPCKEQVSYDEQSSIWKEQDDQRSFKVENGSLEMEEPQRREIGPNNPYTKYFRRRPDRAAIWHTLPPLSFEEMNLSQQAEAITTAIAVDFVKWMESISDEDSPTSLTVPLVLKMFEIGFDTHAARSLQVRVREMASVPDGVAILKGVKDMAKRSQLHRQLLRDLDASKETKRVFAFGTKLEKSYQILPPKMSEIDKWLVCTKVPPHLESMATVWQGITHLRSTRAYCEYLLDHPEITPPKYLIDMKMLDREHLKGQQNFVADADVEPGAIPPRTFGVDEKPRPSQEMMFES